MGLAGRPGKGHGNFRCPCGYPEEFRRYKQKGSGTATCGVFALGAGALLCLCRGDFNGYVRWKAFSPR